MGFGNIIRERRLSQGIPSASEYYKQLGGRDHLGISLRHFQQIESNKFAPSVKMLVRLFNLSSQEKRSDLVIEFFRSQLKDMEESEEFLQYLQTHLLSDKGRPKESLWPQRVHRRSNYSDTQLRFLTDHPSDELSPTARQRAPNGGTSRGAARS